jgi:prevent-host-death family protein
MLSMNVNEARRQFRKVLDAAERGESVEITRRGRRVALVTPLARRTSKRLPDLSSFRASLNVKGSRSQSVIELREQERY